MRLLGAWLKAIPPSSNGPEIQKRILAFQQAGGIFSRFFTNPRIGLRWKVPVLQTVGESTFLSGLETCYLSGHELHKLETVHMRHARRLLGGEGYGKLSKNHMARSGLSDEQVRERLGIMSVSAALTIPQLRWIRALLFRETRDGPGTVPLLAALLGTRCDFEDAPAGHKCDQNHPPRDSVTGALTSYPPPLFHALRPHQSWSPRVCTTESWTEWRDSLMSPQGESALRDYEKLHRSKPETRKTCAPIIIPEPPASIHPPQFGKATVLCEEYLAPHWSSENAWTTNPNAEGEFRCPSGAPQCRRIIFMNRRALGRRMLSKPQAATPGRSGVERRFEMRMPRQK